MREFEDDQLPLFEGFKASRKKRKASPNCLQEMLLELMDKRKVSLAEIQRATRIPWGTLMGWHDGTVIVQKLDGNILALARFFNVHIHYLVYGIGDDEPAFEFEIADQGLNKHLLK